MLTFVTSVFIHQLYLQVGFSQSHNMNVTNNWGHSSSLTSKNEREEILSHNNLKMSWAFHGSKYHYTSSCGQGNAGWLGSMLLEITLYGQISQHSPVEFRMDCYQITLLHIREGGKKMLEKELENPLYAYATTEIFVIKTQTCMRWLKDCLSHSIDQVRLSVPDPLQVIIIKIRHMQGKTHLLWWHSWFNISK